MANQQGASAGVLFNRRLRGGSFWSLSLNIADTHPNVHFYYFVGKQTGT